MSDYEITEKDIEAVMRYLEIYHPENANHDFATALLEYIKSGLHDIARNDPENIEGMYAVYEQYLKNPDRSRPEN